MTTLFTVVEFTVNSWSTGGLQINPTIAAGDFKRSINGGALTNMDNIPVAAGAGSPIITITLSATEQAATRPLKIIGIDQTAVKEWDDIELSVPVYAGLAREGADGDTLETLSDQLDVIGNQIAAVGASVGTGSVV